MKKCLKNIKNLMSKLNFEDINSERLIMFKYRKKKRKTKSHK